MPIFAWRLQLDFIRRYLQPHSYEPHMLSSLLPEWQLQFAQTLMLRSSQRFCALWWRQEETEQLIVWFSMIQSLHVGL